MREKGRMKRMGIVLAAVVLLAGTAARAEQVTLNVALAKPVLKAGHKQTTYLKVGLTGFDFRNGGDRPPVNIAIVIDKSGSMQGEKIRRAREAACMAIDRLGSRDIVSVIAYNHNVQTIVPATKLADRESAKAAIRRLEAGGNTALFAGVSKGAAEIRKFLGRECVNRVILLSDGLANVGPSSPTELGRLGSSLKKNSISVTTIGLGNGYNEDLMSRLAARSDGNHYFAENATDLARLYKGELGDVLSVCAQEVTVTVTCAAGIRPVRVLGREAEITGQRVVTLLNHLYSGQEKYVMLEVEVPATTANRSRPVATVKVAYANMQTKTTDRLTSSVGVRFSASEQVVERKTNKVVMVAAVEQVATAVQREAMKLRDQGRRKEASKMLYDNARFLYGSAKKYKGTPGWDRLQDYAGNNHEGGANVLYMDGHVDYIKFRKSARAYQRYNEAQQAVK